MKVKKHRHKWGKRIHGVFNGPIRVCRHLKCGAVRYATGYIGGGHGGFLRTPEKQSGTQA